MKSIIIFFVLLPIIYGQKTTPATPTSKNTVQFYVTKTNRQNACFIVEFSGLVSITYKKLTKDFSFNSSTFPSAIQQVHGLCDDNYQQMDIPLDELGILSIGTTKFNDKKIYRISSNSSMKVDINETFPNINENGTFHLSINKGYNSEVPLGKYFSCINMNVFQFHSNLSEKENYGSVTTDHLKISAFNAQSKHGIFAGPVIDCLADKIINNIVPLIVGVILAVLVVIVLITYLIGRRHTRSRYQTI